jgi:hypothetical protein
MFRSRTFRERSSIPLMAHVSLVAVDPWSWLRFVKLVQWHVSFVVSGLRGDEVI